MKTLILGGVRSGKSRLAEALALQSGLPVTYIATALPGDEGRCASGSKRIASAASAERPVIRGSYGRACRGFGAGHCRYGL